MSVADQDDRGNLPPADSSRQDAQAANQVGELLVGLDLAQCDAEEIIQGPVRLHLWLLCRCDDFQAVRL